MANIFKKVLKYEKSYFFEKKTELELIKKKIRKKEKELSVLPEMTSDIMTGLYFT